MERRTKGRRVALLVGGVVLAVLLAIGLLYHREIRREIAVRYHLFHLEDDPAPYIHMELLSDSENSPRWEALQRFVRTPPGKEKLLRTYVPMANDALMNVFTDKVKRLGGAGSSVFLLAWVDDQSRLREFVFAKGRPGKASDRGQVAGAIPPKGSFPGIPPVSLVLPLQELLLHARYDKYPVPEDVSGVPGIRFSVVSLGTSDPRCARSLGSSPRGRLGTASHACLFEREGWDFLATPMQ